MRDAPEPGLGGKVVLGALVGEGFGHEQERTIRSDQEERSRHAPEVAHRIRGLVPGLSEKVVQGFQLWAGGH